MLIIFVDNDRAANGGRNLYKRINLRVSGRADFTVLVAVDEVLSGGAASVAEQRRRMRRGAYWWGGKCTVNGR